VGPFAEFAVVFGLCLAVIFVVIPAGTAESDNFGLSPRMLPTVSMVAIAIVSAATLISGLVRRRAPNEAGTAGLFGVLLLVLAAFTGAFLIDRTGIVIGGTALVLLAALAIGERRPAALAGMGALALAILLFVEWSGL